MTAAAPAAWAAATLRVPLTVRENFVTSFLLAAGPNLSETLDKTDAAIGSSSADAGGVSGSTAVGTPMNSVSAADDGVPGVDGVVGSVAAVVAAGAAVGEEDAAGVAGVVVVAVELDLAMPARLARDARGPNLEMRSPRALSASAAAAAAAEEEAAPPPGWLREGEEGGEVEVESPGIEVKIEDQEKLTVCWRRKESGIKIRYVV